MTQLTRVFAFILFGIVTIYSIPLISSANTKTVDELENRIKELTNRLEQLEPDEPMKIYDSAFHPPFPSNIIPIDEVIQTGDQIPFEVGIDRPNWERPVYDEHMHSKYWGGRWSNVSGNLHNARHRMFIGFQSAGIWFDLGESLGIAKELEDQTNPKAFSEEKVNTKMVIVIMQAEVKKIIRKGNQVVLISEPKRNGLQVITVMHDEVSPKHPDKNTLFQLVTPDGFENDYALSY